MSGSSDPRKPAVSVVIPARDDEQWLPAALEAILSQDYEGDVEILVADGSDGLTTDQLLCERFPQVRRVPNPDQNTPSGLNRAIAAAHHDVIVRCDARSVFPPDYISRSVETLLRTGAATVGGRQDAVGTTKFERVVGLATTTWLGVGDARYRLGGREGPTDTVYLGVFRRDALTAVGGFDESLLRNQDYELNWRLRKSGETVWFDPELVVEYRPRGTWADLARQYFEYGLWKRVVLFRHPGSLRLRQLPAPILLLLLLASCLLGAIGGLASRGLLANLISHEIGFALLLAATVSPAVYLALLAAGSLILGLRRRSGEAVLMPLVLATLHIAWGAGFLFGRSRWRPAQRQSRPDQTPVPVPTRSTEKLKISIVVPVLNDRRIGRALDSIITQQHGYERELVIVDACSTDGTLEVVQRYNKDVALLISEPDEGIYDGVNKGISRTDGGPNDVVHYLGADDRYADPLVLRDVMNAFQADEELDACYGNLVYANESGRVVRCWRSGGFRRSKLYYGWLPPHPALFVRRRVYDQCGTFDLRYPVSSDQDFMLRLLLRNEMKVKYLPRVLMIMARGGNSGSFRGIWRGNLDAIRIRRKNGLPAAALVVAARLIRKAFQFVPLGGGMWSTGVDSPGEV